jgi:hypothetical protein
MPYNCLPSSTSTMPADFEKAQFRIAALTGNSRDPFFAIAGTGYNMTNNRNVHVNWQFYSDIYGTKALQDWVSLTVEFADDLVFGTAVIASEVFPVIDQGTPDESFGGIFPLTELNKLTLGNWYVAKLSASDGQELALWPCYLIGGV